VTGDIVVLLSSALALVVVVVVVVVVWCCCCFGLHAAGDSLRSNNASRAKKIWRAVLW
jgi:uncharacterized membrane protein